MNHKYAVFLGDVALDEYYRVSRFPKTAEKILTESLTPQMGGMIANAACVYASYGASVTFLGILNPSDEKLCHNLEQWEIDTSHVVFDESLPPSKCMIFLSEEEREHTVFIVSMDVKDFPIQIETQELLKNASVIYSSCNNELFHIRQGEKKGWELAQEWYENGAKLVCDTDVEPITSEMAKFLPYIHTLFMNEVGFQNQKQEGESQEETVTRLLNTGIRILIVTLAERGCVIYTKHRTLSIPGVPAEVVDVTGAGDTFCSSFTYFYALSENLEQSAVFASYAASLSVTKMGARSGASGSVPVLDYMKHHGVHTKPYEEMLASAPFSFRK